MHQNSLYDELAEQTIIGGLMFNDKTDVALDVLSILKPIDFANESHRFIWQTILHLSSTGYDLNAVTIPSALSDSGSDLSSYAMRLGIEAVSQASLVSTALRLKKVSKLRQAMEAINQASQEILTPGDLDLRMKNALSKLADIDSDDGDHDIKDPVSVMTNVFSIMERAYTSETGLIGISSGFENIDHFTQGFQQPDVIVVAAPPSMGKTTFSLNFAEHAAFLSDAPKKVLFFSLEMSAEQLLQKTISNLGSLYLKKIKTGKALDDTSDVARLAKAQEIIQNRRDYFRIDDKSGQTIAEMSARAKRTQMRLGGLDLIVVDYLHLIHPANQNDGPIEVITKNIQGLKRIAKQLKCPIIVLSQLNRGFTGRPEMKNLLGSSIIEQTADIIFFLYDEDYQGNRGDQSLTEVIVAKNRMGETGSTYLQPELGMSRFADTKRLPAAPTDPEKKYSKRRIE